MKAATHILIEFASTKTHVLYRADGMALACRVQQNVVYGLDPNPAKMISRRFLDETYALAYLRHIADLDANHIAPDDEWARVGIGESLEYGARLDERDGEPRVIKPNSQVISLAN